MIMKSGYFETGHIYIALRALPVILCLVLLPGCSYHPPAPIEEHSGTTLKRQLDPDGNYYVRLGDTLYAIAFDYDLDVRNVAKWNELSSPYIIYPGQKLRLSAPVASSRSSGNSSPVQISVAKTPGRTTTKPISSPEKSSNTKTAQVNTPPASTSKTSKAASSEKMPTGADPKTWQWPTSGKVLRSYVAGDPARNGLDIAGREGQAIIASSGGQVVYSGNGLIGYGELIIIKHSEKMLSAYAHNKVRLVTEGDHVSAGQKIAEMGRNPGNEQLLHFEIRTRGKPVNPLTYLPKK